ncbi:hypothetical protein D3C76_1708740 [compost metagenome]
MTPADLVGLGERQVGNQSLHMAVDVLRLDHGIEARASLGLGPGVRHGQALGQQVLEQFIITVSADDGGDQ